MHTKDLINLTEAYEEINQNNNIRSLADDLKNHIQDPSEILRIGKQAINLDDKDFFEFFRVIEKEVPSQDLTKILTIWATADENFASAMKSKTESTLKTLNIPRMLHQAYFSFYNKTKNS